jgi:hypothetical protein
MKKIILSGTILLIMLISGNVCARTASDGVVVLIKVEHALKLEIDEKRPEFVQPQKTVPIKSPFRDIRKSFFPVTLTHTVTE